MKQTHTAGPLTVKPSNNWPFDLITFNAEGEQVFTTRLPCHSSRMKSFKDALNGVGFKETSGEFSKENCIQKNKKALADEILRAASPDLLEALQRLLKEARQNSFNANGSLSDTPAEAAAMAAINKATGKDVKLFTPPNYSIEQE